MREIIRAFVKFIDKFRLRRLSRIFIDLISRGDYAHSLSWFGAKIFQTPTDLFLYQQLIHKSRPNLIIETGVAKGGSVLFACQMLHLLHSSSSPEIWRVVCSDINSMDEAERTISKFGYKENVVFFRGNSASQEFANLIREVSTNMNNVCTLLSLDSNHTEEHVFDELKALSRFVSKDSYAVVWDSRIGDLSDLTHYLRPRAWNKRHHAGTGVLKFMKSAGGNLSFCLDTEPEEMLLIAGTKNGILKKL